MTHSHQLIIDKLLKSAKDDTERVDILARFERLKQLEYAIENRDRILAEAWDRLKDIRVTITSCN